MRGWGEGDGGRGREKGEGGGGSSDFHRSFLGGGGWNLPMLH